MPQEFPELLTALEVADMLRVKRGTLRRAAANLGLREIKIGRELRYFREDVDRVLADAQPRPRSEA